MQTISTTNEMGKKRDDFESLFQFMDRIHLIHIQVQHTRTEAVKSSNDFCFAALAIAAIASISSPLCFTASLPFKWSSCDREYIWR